MDATPRPGPDSAPLTQPYSHRRQRSASLPALLPPLSFTTTTTTTIHNVDVDALFRDDDTDLSLHYRIVPVMPGIKSKAALVAPRRPSTQESIVKRPSSPPSLKKSKSFSQKVLQTIIVGPAFVGPTPPALNSPPPPLPPPKDMPGGLTYRLDVNVQISEALKNGIEITPAMKLAMAVPPPLPASRKHRSPFQPKPVRPPAGPSKLRKSSTSLSPPASRPSSPSPDPSLQPSTPKKKKLDKRPLHQQVLLTNFGQTPHGALIIRKGAVKGIKAYEAEESEKRAAALQPDEVMTMRAVPSGVTDKENEQPPPVVTKKNKGWKRMMQSVWAHVQDGLADDLSITRHQQQQHQQIQPMPVAAV